MKQFEVFIRKLMSEIVVEDFAKSLQILKDFLNEKTKKHNTVINQLGQYAQLQHTYFNSAIETQEYFQGVSSLRMKLVDFIDKLQEKDFKEIPDLDKLEINKPHYFTTFSRGESNDFRAEIISKAIDMRGELCVAGVANTDFFASLHQQDLHDILLEALRKGMKARILFLDPNSNAAFLRHINENYLDMGTTINTIKICIETAKSNILKIDGGDNLKIRLAQEMPCYLFFNQDSGIYHPYFVDKTGNKTPTYYLEGQSLDMAKSHFERLWGERWVLFDLGNVLISFDHKRVSRGLLKCIPIKRRGSSTQGEIDDFFFKPQGGPSLNEQLDKGIITLEQANQQFNERFDVKVNFDKFEKIWCSIFDKEGLDRDAINCLRKIKESGVKVGICSDTNASHWNYITTKYPELNDKSIEKFLSFNLKHTKAEPDFFRMIALKNGRPYQEHLLIDDRDLNLEVASSIGLKVMKAQKKIRCDSIFEFLNENLWL